jgi:hypothetical protein
MKLLTFPVVCVDAKLDLSLWSPEDVNNKGIEKVRGE